MLTINIATKIDPIARNATFSAKEAKAAYLDSPIVTELQYVVNENRKGSHAQTRILSMEGPTGFGKSATTNYVLEEIIEDDLKILSLYMPWVKMDRLQLQIPYTDENGDRRLRSVTDKQLLAADVILLEESARVSDPQVKNFMMELIEGSIGGEPLHEGVTVVHINNPHGSSGVSASKDDLAQATRKRHIVLQRDDMPWQLALAATFPQTNLSKFFVKYDELTTLYKGAADYLAPRTLEHILYAAGNDFPAVWGLPIVGGKRDSIKSEDGKDVTNAILRSLVEAAGLNYVEAEPTLTLVERAIETVISDGFNIFLDGPAGMGKSQFANRKISELGYAPHLIQGPNTAASRHLMTVPSGADKSTIETVISDRFNPRGYDSPVVGYVDEIHRASDAVKNVFLEILGPTRKLGDQKLPFKAFVATDNPAQVGDFKMMLAGSKNRALAERFHLSVSLDIDSLDPMSYLTNKHGKDIDPLVEWWLSDLKDADRFVVNPRVLENMFSALKFAQGRAFSLERTMRWISNELPMIGSERMGPNVSALRARIAKSAPATLDAIVANAAQYEADLKNVKTDAAAARKAAIALMEVLNKSLVSKLEENFDVLADLAQYLSAGDRANILTLALADKKSSRSKLLPRLLTAKAKRK